MENKHVGLLIIGIAIVFFLVVISFNQSLESIVDATCTHGESCTMHVTIKTQKIISYSLIGLLVLVGGFVALFMKDEKLRGEAVLTKEEKRKKLEKLDEEEKKVMELVLQNKGSIYQSDLLKEAQFSKVKITRILDKLEGKSLVERKRRGMTNIVILK